MIIVSFVSDDYASAILLISSNDDPGQTAIQTDDPRGFGKETVDQRIPR